MNSLYNARAYVKTYQPPIKNKRRKKKMINITQVFPAILILLDICASAVYACKGNWRMVVYWAAAAALTFVVTF